MQFKLKNNKPIIGSEDINERATVAMLNSLQFS